MKRHYELNIPGIAGGLQFTERCVLDYLCAVITENRDAFVALIDLHNSQDDAHRREWLRARDWEALVVAQAINNGEPYAHWDSPEAVRVNSVSGVTRQKALDPGDILYHIADLLYNHRAQLHASLGKERCEELRYARLAEAIFIAEIVLIAAGDDTATKQDKARVQRTNEIWSAKANRRLSNYISDETRRAHHAAA